MRSTAGWGERQDGTLQKSQGKRKMEKEEEALDASSQNRFEENDALGRWAAGPLRLHRSPTGECGRTGRGPVCGSVHPPR